MKVDALIFRPSLVKRRKRKVVMVEEEEERVAECGVSVTFVLFV